MKYILPLMLFVLWAQTSESARIRNRKVKEAPRVCKLMIEDKFLSRENKKVLGTLRHSILIEDNEENHSVTLVKDKGEKICQWKLEQWQNIVNENKLPAVTDFKFHIDEYKEILYPYVQKEDQSYFMMSIPIKTCDLNTQVTRVKLELPKCEPPKKAKKRRTVKKKAKAKPKK